MNFILDIAGKFQGPWFDAATCGGLAHHGLHGKKHGPIAQRSEQVTHNHLVGGSIPSGPTKIFVEQKFW